MMSTQRRPEIVRAKIVRDMTGKSLIRRSGAGAGETSVSGEVAHLG